MAKKQSKVQNIYDLSPMQEGMLFHALLKDDEVSYFEQVEYTLKGAIDLKAYDKSFNDLIRRYEVLRAVFLHEKVLKPKQVILKERNTTVALHDISHLNDSEAKEWIHQFRIDDRKKGFNLSKDVLIRAAVIKKSATNFITIWSYHHILMDGWCADILFKEFLLFYKSSLRGVSPELPAVAPYKNYIDWLKKQDFELSKEYWKTFLSEYETFVDLPGSKENPNSKVVNRHSRITKQFSKEESDQIRRLTSSNNISMASFLQTVWGILLQKYNNKSDVIFGSIVSGRPAEVLGIDDMIGLFINTIPVRVKSDKQTRFIDLAQGLMHTSALSKEHEFFPLAEIQNLSEQKSNLINHIFVVENFNIVDDNIAPKKSIDSGLRIETIEAFEQSHYDLSVVVNPKAQLEIDWSFNLNRFSVEFIETIRDQVTKLILDIVAQPELKVSDLEIISAEEENLVQKNFNETKEAVDLNKTLVQAFEEVVSLKSELPALAYNSTVLTYKELNSRANKVAHKLIAQGVGPNSIVPLLIDRSEEIIIGILAVMKAGGAYLPIDPAFPENRIKYFLEDSRANIILSSSKKEFNIPVNIQHIKLNDSSIDPLSNENPNVNLTADDLAYVIYTSGSTGNPKGVLIEHRNVLNLVHGLNKEIYSHYENEVQLNIALVASYIFDASVKQIFSSLLLGHSLHVIDNELKQDSRSWISYYQENQINISDGTPALLQILIQDELGFDSNSSFKQFIIGGEGLQRQTVLRLLDKFPTNKKPKITNVYGPTECCVDATSILVEPYLLDRYEILPIGKPMANHRLYILDQYDKLVGINVPGELCIAGSGVARGYLNNPELTKEKYVKNPFSEKERMYRTGDLVQWTPDGILEFLGRIDRQVKIRGYRIELGEIENSLLSHPSISNVALVDLKNNLGEVLLCAYYESDQPLELPELKAYLLEDLPEYMVPSFFIKVDAIPLTPSGKIDRRSLPDPANIDLKEDFVAPETEDEKKLAAIWSEVLGVSTVGINDNFFDLGGHSLKTIELASRILKTFEISIGLADIFNAPILSQQLTHIRGAGNETQMFHSIGKSDEKEYYHLSSAQRRLFLIDQIEGKGLQYNIPAVLNINGNLDVKKFELSLNAILQRHSSLRTSFHMENGTPVQRIHPHSHYSISINSVDESSIHTKLHDFITPFDLDKAPLIRCELLQLSEDRFVLLFDIHHIISDGVSTQNFIRELVQCYRGEALEALSIQYSDYSEWQHQFIQEEDYQKQKAYWLNQFKDSVDPLNLPLDFSRPAIQSFEGKTATFRLEGKRFEQIQELCKTHGCTPFMLLMGLYNLVLHKYSGNETINVGTAVAGRTHPDLKSLIGIFINTLVIKSEINPDHSFLDFLESTKKSALDAFSNQDYPFEELVDDLNLERDLSRNSMFDTMFILQNTSDKNEQLSLGEGISVQGRNYENKTSIFDITVEATEYANFIQFNFRYCTKLFKAETIDRLFESYQLLVDQIGKTPETPIRELIVLNDTDVEYQLQNIGRGEDHSIPKITLPELFDQQVAATPESIALEFGSAQLSYQELKNKVDNLACYLLEQGVQSEDIIAVLLDRSMEMVIALLAIQKAGAAYLPIDPEHPLERIDYVLQDSNAKAVLTQSSLVSQVTFSGFILKMDEPADYQSQNSGSFSYPKIAPSNLAYVIYTSGSTGLPKGALLQHDGVINRIYWMKEHYGISSKDVILQKTTYVFDVSVWEFFMTLSFGAKLVICKKEAIYDPSLLMEILQKHEITTMHFVPSMYNVFLNTLSANDLQQLNSLTQIFTSGEALQLETVKKHHELLSHVKLHNLYGPTEASVDVSYFETDSSNTNIPIGKPVWNTQLYVLDQHINLVPTGTIGELHISGVQVARGYLNREELTEERFIPNPFEPENKLYKTGDLVRWLPDGNLSYEGRIDHQVKIRGFRIELGEIENALLQHAKVNEAVVIDRKDQSGENYLCGYFVTAELISDQELTALLGKSLPDYMVPAYFIRLDQIPLTSNGKLDRRNLPDPSEKAVGQQQITEPTNELETQLLHIWKELLDNDQIGIEHNFFRSGGQSLKAVQLSGLIHQAFNVKIPIKDFFQFPTIKSLSQNWSQFSGSLFSSIEPAPKLDKYPVSAAQRRMFVLNTIEADAIHYNMPGAVWMNTKPSLEKLQSTINALVKRHESFRTTFTEEDGQFFQIITSNSTISIEELEVSDTENVDQLFAKFIRPFDLNQAPICRIALIKESDSRYLLVFDMHHIISDGQSMQLLLSDFISIYKGKTLDPLLLQYKDFAFWQVDLFKGDKITPQKQYWSEQFEGDIPVLTLPYDFPRPINQQFEGAHFNFKIESTTASKLNKIAQEHEATTFMVMLSLFKIWLSKSSGQEDLIIGSPIAGRSHADFESIIGMFVNTLAFRSAPSHDKNFSTYLTEIRQLTLDAYENQEFPFDELVDSLDLERHMSRNPLFDAMLVFQNLNKIKEGGLNEFEGYESKHSVAKFDLNLTISEFDNGLSCKLSYATSLFTHATIENMVSRFISLIEQITIQPQILIGDLQLTSKKEKETLLVDFNNTKVDYQARTNVVDLFETQVQKFEHAPALEFNGNTLSYSELNTKVNQLARYISSQSDKTKSSNAFVGIMLERSEWMIISVLATLKCGLTYVPIDHSYPTERKQFILNDANVSLLISHNDLLKGLNINCEVVDVQNIQSPLEGIDSNNLALEIEANQSAYVIYTSGSTGNPKGCELSHGNFYNYVSWATNHYFESQNNETGHFGLYTSLSFDLTITSIFCALLRGKSLHLFSEEEEMSIILEQMFSPDSIIDSVKITPAHISLLQHLDISKTNIQVAIVGGDQLLKEQVDLLHGLNPNMEVYNEYGPTEATVGCVVKEIKASDTTIQIGTPIANTQVYIVDKGMNPVPIGHVGELCIAGVQVSKGYLNRPELTSEKFVSNVFEDGSILYKTGDLARWTKDAELEYVGRLDQQVKIKGHRIELGEVEGQIRALNLVDEIVVLDRMDASNQKYLCSYFVGKDTNSEELRAKLEENIPEHLIPSFFIQLDAIPLTINGKVDKKALPLPNQNAVKNRTIVAATNPIEKEMVRIWEEVLHIEGISITDSFLAIGGDSIKAIQVASRLKKIKLRLSVKNLLSHRTIQKCAPFVQESTITFNQEAVIGEVPFTAIQSEFFKWNLHDAHHYNQSYLLYNAQGIDAKILQASIGAIVEHHDALRARFITTNESVLIQEFASLEETSFELEIFDLTSIESSKLAETITLHSNAIQASHVLADGALFKGALFQTNEGDHLLLSAHHLIIDGVSWRIILEDLDHIYRQLKNGAKVQISSKTSSLKDWTLQTSKFATSTKLQREVHYWNSIAESQSTPITEKDVTDNSVEDSQQFVSVNLSSTLTQNLLTKAGNAYNTEINDLLLSALTKALHQWKGGEIYSIALEGHGREEVFENIDVTRTVGWFTSLYPVLLNNVSDSLDELIIHTKENLRKIPNKGIGYGILKEKTDQVAHHKSQIIFNYLGQFDSASAQGDFTGSSYSQGANSSAKNKPVFPIEINGSVKNEQLRFGISYWESAFTSSEMEEFQQLFEQSLTQIIEFCTQQTGVVQTPSDFGDLTLNLEDFEYIKSVVDKDDSEIEQIYPLSPMQQGMVFHELMDNDSGMYYEQSIFSLAGRINLEKFESSFQKVIERHDVLRTIFITDMIEAPRQVVLASQKTKINFIDISSQTEEEQIKSIESLTQLDLNSPFDLASDLLMRVTLVKQGDSSFTVIWGFHHVLMDGWCLAIILKDFFHFYYGSDDTIVLSNTVPYKEYLDWLRNQNQDEALEYWKSIVGNFSGNSTVPGKIQGKTGQSQSDQFDKSTLIMDSEKMEALQKTSINSGVTLFNLIQTAWGILLQKFNLSDEALVGTVISGRPPEISGVEDMVGLFINTIPVHIGRAESFIQLAKNVQDQFTDSSRYGFLPLADIQNLSDLKNELVNHILVYESFPVSEQATKITKQEEELRIVDVNVHEQTNYDFTLTIIPGKELKIHFGYNLAVYDKIMVERMIRSFEQILVQVIKNPNLAIPRIDLLDQQDTKALLDRNPIMEPIRNSDFLDLFEQNVIEFNQNMATKHLGTSRNYNELNERSNQIAHALIEKGIQKNDVVAIFTSPCLEMVEAMLGILKAGACYLPVDLKYPDERVAYMLMDSNVKIYLHKGEPRGAQNFKGEILKLQDDSWKSTKSHDPKVDIEPEDSAYIIYTSGSTGTPKGVLISHEGLIDYTETMQDLLELTEKDTVVQHASIGFDASIQEIFALLSVGGRIVLPKDNKDLSELADLIASGDITYICTSPLVLNFFSEENLPLGNLRVMCAGGDEMKAGYVRDMPQKVVLWNAYGPTEATVCASFHKVRGNESRIPIGLPIRNRTLYVCNQDGNLLPDGFSGELIIGGKGQALRYLNLPELTSEKFITNPWLQGTTMYKSGDLVRWNELQEMDFFGRIDGQVQIRGYRVEIGEIEAKLTRMKGIYESAVVAYEDNQTLSKYLCAYVSTEMSEEEIIDVLKINTPDYMIPSYFVFLDKLPLTTNRKVDRKALPSPQSKINIARTYLAPKNNTEVRLQEIWENVLEVERIGSNDNFFDLGGHSIKAMTVLARIHRILGVKIKMQDIFANPTIIELGNIIDESDQTSTFQGIEKVSKQANYALSPAQNRLWLLDQIHGGSADYNIPGIITLDQEIEVSILQTVLNSLIERHESLRTNFIVENEEPKQVIHDTIDFQLEFLDYSSKKLSQGNLDLFYSERKSNVFNLEKDQLIRATLIKEKQDRFHLIYVIHHIVSDGWSMRLLLNETRTLYDAIHNEKDVQQQLSPLSIQYKDYAHWQNIELSGERLNEHQNYWHETLRGTLPELSLPQDFSYSADIKHTGSSYTYFISEDNTKLISDIAARHNTSVFTVLLTGFNILLSRLSDLDDIIIGTPVAGRNHESLQNLVGFFLNTVILRNQITREDSFEKLLSQVNERTLLAMEHQNYPFEKLVDDLEIPRDLNKFPITSTFFNMVNLGNETERKLTNFDSSHQAHNHKVKFDLNFYATQFKNGIKITCDYKNELFTDKTAEVIVHKFDQLLSQGLQNITAPIGLLQTDSKLQPTFASSYPAWYTPELTITSRWDQVVTEFGPSVAVHSDEILTYDELEKQCNQRAHYIEKEIGSGNHVGLCVQHNQNMVIGLLSILKSGNIYVPLDPNYPKSRLELILDETVPKMILMDQSTDPLVQEITSKQDTVIVDIANSAFDQEKTSLPETSNQIKASDTAYVLYTSGSTGRPKGSIQTHGAVVHFISNYGQVLNITSTDRLTGFSSICFDSFVNDLYGALFHGASYHPISLKAGLDFDRLSDQIIGQGISIWHSVPSVFRPFSESPISNKQYFPSLRIVKMTGEPSVKEDFEKFKLITNEEAQFVVSYGATETTLTTINLFNHSSNIQKRVIAAGHPIAATTIKIVHPEGKYQRDVLESGEIVVHSPFITQGYLSNPALNKEIFMEIEGSTYYRTGDLGRMNSQGALEIHGRKDSQVKIRGIRIEIAEIENALNQLTSVRNATINVEYGTDQQAELIAYLVIQDELKNQVSAMDVINHLRPLLPDYMIPSGFVELESIPKTPNGKIDRKALIPSIGTVLALSNDFIAPRNETEEALASIWKHTLGKSQIGVFDNFFELGGHSIKAIGLVARIHKELESKIAVRELFENPTIDSLAKLISGRTQSTYSGINILPKQDHYELSPAQNRLWLLDQIHEGSSDYNLPGLINLDQKIDGKVLEQVLKHQILRHESLRTNFIVVNETPRQFVHAHINFELEVLDLSDNKDFNESLLALYSVRKSTQFNLEHDSLIRATLVKENEERYHLIYIIHHIVSDRWSLTVLFKETKTLYEAYIRTNSFENTLTPLPVQYKDYAAWQNSELQGDELVSHQNYWHETLHGKLPQLTLPLDYNKDDKLKHTGSSFKFHVKPATLDALNALAVNENKSAYMILLTAFNILMARLSDQEDIIIGTPVAGRDHEDLQQLVGFFLNTVILRNQVSVDSSFEDLLTEINERTLQAMEHQSYPFEQLVDDLNIPRDVNRFPIASVFFNMLNMGDEAEQEVHDLSDQHSFHNSKVKFDLNFYATRYKNTILIVCDYKNELFSPKTITLFGEKFNQILENALHNPTASIQSWPLQSIDSEKEETTSTSYPDWYDSNSTIISQWQRTVNQFGKRNVVHFDAQPYSYEEIDHLTNKLAHNLVEQFGSKGNHIGLLVGHNQHMLIGLLSILKSGNIYVPLDPNYPKERLDSILDDTDPKLILSDQSTQQLLSKLTVDRAQIELIDLNDKDAIHHEKSHLPEIAGTINATDTAYILFTSGSSGKPKGTIQTHGAVVHFISNYIQGMGITPEDRLTGFSSICFDSFVNDLYGTIFSGACYYPNALKSGMSFDEISDWIQQNQLTVWHSVPSVFRPFSEEMILQQIVLNSLRIVKMTGEPSIREDFSKFKQITSPQTSFVVSYGATETTLTSFHLLGHSDVVAKRVIPAGKPIAGTSLRILNKYELEADVLETGEILVSSPFITTGYLNNPELNASAFIEQNGKQYYRTGDLGRLDSGGNLHILGRKDNQVKIRGIRIETGEIENALNRYETIRTCAIKIEYDSEEQAEIVAFIVFKDQINDPKITSGDIIKHLKQRLPDYMIPSVFIQIDALPKTPNGKIDRLSLERAIGSELVLSNEFVAAESQLEEDLVSIWMKILNKERIGIHDNFFELGGQSLKATQVISRIKSQLNKQVKLKDLFMHPTIYELVQAMEQYDQELIVPLEPAPILPHYAVSNAQKRLWIIEKINGPSNMYNMPRALKVHGDLNVQALRDAYNDLLKRHEGLRTIFFDQDGVPMQKILDMDQIEFPLEVTDLSEHTDVNERAQTYLEEDVAHIFQLDTFPLITTKVVKTGESDCLILFNMHHIISDGWSMSILIRELFSYYDAHSKGTVFNPEPLTIQYKDYSVWQQKRLSEDRLNTLRDYWHGHLRNYPTLNIPLDHKRPEMLSHEGSAVYFTFPEQFCGLLEQFSKDHKTTNFVSLVTIVSILLNKYCDQHDIILGTPIAGRDESELESIIGLFVNTVILRNELDLNKSISDNVAKIKENTINAFEHQEYPFEYLVNELVRNRQLDRNPLIDVAIALQNTNDREATERISLDNLEINNLSIEEQSSKFDLIFGFFISKDRISLRMEYSTSLFQQATIDLMLERLEAMIETVCSDPESTIRNVKMTSKTELKLESEFKDLEDGFNF